MSLQRVFIPQLVTRFDHSKGHAVPMFDFSPAAQYGQLTPILDESDDPLFLARLAPKIRKMLDGFTEHDYLLAVGDPTVIAICAGLILRRHSNIKMLKWDRKMFTYIVLEIRP